MVLPLAPISTAEPATRAGGICRFVMDAARARPRYKPRIEKRAQEMLDTRDGRCVLDKVSDLLVGFQGLTFLLDRQY
jgi:hypothetical protein